MSLTEYTIRFKAKKDFDGDYKIPQLKPHHIDLKGTHASVAMLRNAKPDQLRAALQKLTSERLTGYINHDDPGRWTIEPIGNGWMSWLTLTGIGHWQRGTPGGTWPTLQYHPIDGVSTYANGFGTWHAIVSKACTINPATAAYWSIVYELTQRENNFPNPDVQLIETTTSGDQIFRETYPTPNPTP